MAWRSGLGQVTLPDGRALVAGSFRGVPFRTLDAELQVGRRNVVNEYPQRDLPYVDDLGRRARRFVVDAYVLGDNYLAERNALIDALEVRGPGELMHPRHGLLWVSVDGAASIKESPSTGGMARFTVTFVEAGQNNFPTASTRTSVQVEAAANAVDDAAQADFQKKFSVQGPSVLAVNAIKDLSKTVSGMLEMARRVTDVSGLAEIVRQAGLLTGGLADLIRTPVVLVQDLRSIYAQAVQVVRRPLWALAELRSVFGANARLSAAALRGSTLARSVANDTACADLHRRLALSNQARVLALAIADPTAVATRDQAIALRDVLVAQISTELEANDPPPTVTRTLIALRAAVVRDVAARAEFLRLRSTYTPRAVLPAVVLAHRIYQDATRADELMARNGLGHPAFVPVRELEVLL